ncbi:MAG TPA: HAD-IA family hydrolase [Ktedonobacteraceae bacterium]|jgi:REG-2-like HAD superfamily hydrolase|nr:HAD-IA family hydrolase [Ktedonobacteraceae bacterium]
MSLEQPQSIRTIFFDAGFTLLYPYPSTPEICQRICQQLGLHIHLDKLQERMPEADDYFFRLMRSRRHAWASENTINEFWLDYYMNFLRPFVEEHNEALLYQLALAITREFNEHTSWQIYPDALPTLDTLKKHGYTLGVISDWGISLTNILRAHKLNHYFDSVLVSAIHGNAKPSPMIFEEALRRTNSIADYTMHIGDSYIHDVLGARTVGITPVLLDRPEHLQPTNVDCLLVHSLTEVPKLLEIV